MRAEVFGAPLAHARLRVGHDAQIATIESSVRTDGQDAGSRRIRIVNGDLDIEILPDRGLDLGQVRVAGIPLACRCAGFDRTIGRRRTRLAPDPAWDW